MSPHDVMSWAFTVLAVACFAIAGLLPAFIVYDAHRAVRAARAAAVTPARRSL